MPLTILLVLLTAASVFAERRAQPELLPALQSVPTVHATPRAAVLVGSAVFAAASVVTGFYVGYFGSSSFFASSNTLRPLGVTAGLAAGTVLGAAVVHLLVPEAVRFFSGGSSGALRAQALRHTTWSMVAFGASAALMGVGGALETRSWGQGQPLMVAGAGGMLVSSLAFVVLYTLAMSASPH